MTSQLTGSWTSVLDVEQCSRLLQLLLPLLQRRRRRWLLLLLLLHDSVSVGNALWLRLAVPAIHWRWHDWAECTGAVAVAHLRLRRHRRRHSIRVLALHDCSWSPRSSYALVGLRFHWNDRSRPCSSPDRNLIDRTIILRRLWCWRALGALSAAADVYRDSFRPPGLGLLSLR